LHRADDRIQRIPATVRDEIDVRLNPDAERLAELARGAVS
jgi:hypothetical protein